MSATSPIRDSNSTCSSRTLAGSYFYKAQWSPILIAPLLAIAAFASIKSRRVAFTALPALSAVAGADAAVGFFYHARGVLRRPGGSKHLIYNIMYGPPIFAPLLFGAAGMLGALASPAAGTLVNSEQKEAANI